MTDYTARLRTIYFVRRASGAGAIKIGCSVAPERRRQQLEIAVGAPLVIIASLPGSMDQEGAVHSLFWHDHLGGEWFSWSPILKLLIDSVRRGEADLNGLPPRRTLRRGKRRPWTESQKLRARYQRRIAKAERVNGQRFPHFIGHRALDDSWETLIPEIERFLAEAA